MGGRVTSVFVLLTLLSLALAERQKQMSSTVKMLEQLADTRKGLSALKLLLGDIDGDLQREQRSWDPTCHIGGGNPGIRCHMKGISGNSKAQDWLSANAWSPGKRAAPVRSKLDNLSRKRKGLEILKRILGEMDADLIHEQKRMCLVNLGGHCATESAASVADQWHYLNSPLSPGRKRRDTRLFNRLVSGKLFQ